ncbi:MAG: DedA family protein, partial [Pseudomonadota bacterium]
DLVEALFDYLADLSGPFPYLLIFFALFLCGFGVPIPEDIILITAGYLAYEAENSLAWMIIVGLSGVLIGDCVIFYLGKRYGLRLTQFWPFKQLLHPERIDQIREKLSIHGNKLIFAARFLPGLRAGIFFCSGCFGVPFKVFFFYDGMAALISVPAIVGLTYHFGEHIDRAINVIRHVENGIIFVILSIVLLIFLKWWIPRYWQSRKKG